MDNLLKRYQDGEYLQVWADLRRLGNSVNEGTYTTSAWLVAEETMRRVRTNIENIITKLRTSNYDFDGRWLDLWKTQAERLSMRQLHAVFTEPDIHVEQNIVLLEKTVGNIRLSLKTFYKFVGSVNLSGKHPLWNQLSLDPLQITSLDYVLNYWLPWQEVEEDKSTEIYIASDETFKDGAGGSGPYIIEVPDPSADGILHWQEDSYFIDYLRLCFKWGGFPGWRWHDDYPRKDIAYLTSDLIPL